MVQELLHLLTSKLWIKKYSKKSKRVLTAEVSKYFKPISCDNREASSRTISARESFVPSRYSHLFPTKTPIKSEPDDTAVRTPK